MGHGDLLHGRRGQKVRVALLVGETASGEGGGMGAWGLGGRAQTYTPAHRVRECVCGGTSVCPREETNPHPHDLWTSWMQ
jgi:hypothetical protein